MKNYSQSQQAAAKELLIRRRARDSILDYANAIEIPGKPATDDPDTEFFQPIETTIADHHRLILNKIDECSKTRHGRLMIFMPPGAAKSTYASVLFPSYYLGKNPGKKVILASYGDDLATKMGRRTRSIIKQKRFKGIFNSELTKESSSAQQFILTNGSEYMSGGLLSGITGNRANGVIIDDPVKGREQADSPVIRQKTFDSYEENIKTRLIPGGWLVIIQTRWHIEDLAGQILPDGWNGESGKIECRDGNTWDVVCLQAKCENEVDPLGRKIGEYLWPEWFDLKHWQQFQSIARTWAALFQQRPTITEGNFFKPDMMPIVDAVPSGLRYVRAWDFAATADDGDYTVGVQLGYDDKSQIAYIVDAVRGQFAPEEVERILLNTAKSDGYSVKIRIPQDPGQAGKSQVKAFVKMLSGFSTIAETVSGDKQTRASPVAAQLNVGNVYMLRGAFNRPLLEELRHFPNGKNDDQIDALSDAYNHFVNKKRLF